MNSGGDAAEQVIRLSLNGVEVAAKITGAAAKHIAILLYTILKDQNQNKQTCKKGKASLKAMMKSGKELTMFTVKNSDLAKFTEVAKKYGVLYCALTDRNNKDPNAQVDIITKAECAPMINRIVERYGMSSVTQKDTILPKPMVRKDRESGIVDMSDKKDKEPDIGAAERLLDDLLGKPMRQKEPTTNLPMKKTERFPLSRNILDTPMKSAKDTIKSPQEPTVKKELQALISNRKKQSKVSTMKKSQKFNEAR